MVVSWFSAGVSSFIATYLMKDEVDKIIYIDIDDQHEDSLRFVKDCEKLLGKPIEILKSRYGSVENVIKQFKYVNGPYGARCTSILKKRVRKEWEDAHKGEDITYIWGYDLNEKHRQERLVEAMPNFEHRFPLIEKELTKEDVHGMCWRLGVERPKMYELGYPNNNCIGCVKGGKGYWNKIRIDFPAVFERMAKLEREIGATCIKETYLDELDPKAGREQKVILDDCGISCQMNI